MSAYADVFRHGLISKRRTSAAYNRR